MQTSLTKSVTLCLIALAVGVGVAATATPEVDPLRGTTDRRN